VFLGAVSVFTFYLYFSVSFVRRVAQATGEPNGLLSSSLPSTVCDTPPSSSLSLSTSSPAALDHHCTRHSTHIIKLASRLLNTSSPTFVTVAAKSQYMMHWFHLLPPSPSSMWVTSFVAGCHSLALADLHLRVSSPIPNHGDSPTESTSSSSPSTLVFATPIGSVSSSSNVCWQSHAYFDEETQRWRCGGRNKPFSDKYGTERHTTTIGPVRGHRIHGSGKSNSLPGAKVAD